MEDLPMRPVLSFAAMPDPTQKVPEGAPGRYYVDLTCSMCDICTEEAPMLLKANEDKTYVYFHRQPANPAEEKAARAAMEVCPTSAIGNDG
jgi:ferredoxin